MKIGALIITEPANVLSGALLGLFAGYFLGKSCALEKQLDEEHAPLEEIEQAPDIVNEIPKVNWWSVTNQGHPETVPAVNWYSSTGETVDTYSSTENA